MFKYYVSELRKIWPEKNLDEILFVCIEIIESVGWDSDPMYGRATKLRRKDHLLVVIKAGILLERSISNKQSAEQFLEELKKILVEAGLVQPEAIPV